MRYKISYATLLCYYTSCEPFPFVFVGRSSGAMWGTE